MGGGSWLIGNRGGRTVLKVSAARGKVPLIRGGSGIETFLISKRRSSLSSGKVWSGDTAMVGRKRKWPGMRKASKENTSHG